MIVSKSNIQVESVENCLLCGRKGLSLYSLSHDGFSNVTGLWSVYNCPYDGLVWLNPRPRIEEMQKIYECYFTHAVQDRQPNLLRRIIKEAILASAFGYDKPNHIIPSILGKILNLIPPLKERVGTSIAWLKRQGKGRLLDIGCGNGEFLATMRTMGWKVMGVEPDTDAAKIAREHFDIPVRVGTFEEVTLPDDFFDAIVLRHIIEHSINPIRLLRKCKGILKPGGRLIVITPNIESLGYRFFKESWVHLDPPRHFYLFSCRTLKTCVERAGFCVDVLRTLTWGICTASWTYCASRLIHKNGSFFAMSFRNLRFRLKLEGIIFQTLEHFLQLLRYSIGEEVLIIARKL